MPARIRQDEAWAKLVIEKHLGQPIQQNDDGSRGGMYDLRLGPEDYPAVAIECVKDADCGSMRVWKKGPNHGCFNLQTRGDWLIELSSSAKVESVVKAIGDLLARLHAAGVFVLHSESREGQAPATLAGEFSRLGILAAHCCDIDGSGRVYFLMMKPGGIVDVSGARLAEWTTSFINGEDRQDVLRKLLHSGAEERHVCIILTLNGTLDAPLIYHFLAENEVPTVAPDLPPQ
jgi:hypothetical protein